ncbi:c-type cytochrome [Pseudoroseomonas globiformis]|uniref:C-type cytochrome n=1 Tax=Teichococcus globiformis TaxID=2307229 RepID=A0ABV7G808_9PROT
MNIRLTWRRAALALGGVLAAGFLFAWSGLFHVGATGGHWAVTNWFLHWVMRNSVRTAALTVEAPPDLDDRALVARAAGHYATGCAPCHGAPGEKQNPVIAQSLPAPPDFSHALDPWSPQELFVIVQQGVRYSGMPAWIEPMRRDEIWSVVAFLQRMPAMSSQDYQALSVGDGRPPGAGLHALSAPAPEAVADCARCHGRDGVGRDGDAFPIIAGQSEAYLLETLRAFAGGTRRSGMMQPAAARATDEDLQGLAAHYAAQPRVAAPAPSVQDAVLEEGGLIAREGIPLAQVPACLSCHGAAALARNPAWPRLDGQHADYLEGQLAAWRDGARGGGTQREVMATVAERLTPGQARAVAAWFASQPVR